MSDEAPLSIVVAVTEGAGTLGRPAPCPAWLAALRREAHAVGAELLFAGSDATLATVRAHCGSRDDVPIRFLQAPADALTPELWGLGLAAARGGVVAFTIDQCVVRDGWAHAALMGIAGGDAGVGGPIALAADASRTARAIYYLRYSAFLASDAATSRRVRDIAGDNAAYRRDVLLRYEGAFDRGFWEVEAHHRMRADGDTLALIPGMTASFGGSPALRPFLRHRFAHGAHFGAWRVAAGGRRPWQIVAAAPLVPLVLLIRVGRAVVRSGSGLGAFLGAGAPFAALAMAWATGEAAGAIRGRPRSALDGSTSRVGGDRS